MATLESTDVGYLETQLAHHREIAARSDVPVRVRESAIRSAARVSARIAELGVGAVATEVPVVLRGGTLVTYHVDGKDRPARVRGTFKGWKIRIVFCDTGDGWYGANRWTDVHRDYLTVVPSAL